MLTLCLQKKKCLQKKCKAFQFCMVKDAVQNAREKVAKSLDFEENGNFIRASSN